MELQQSSSGPSMAASASASGGEGASGSAIPFSSTVPEGLRSEKFTEPSGAAQDAYRSTNIENQYKEDSFQGMKRQDPQDRQIGSSIMSPEQRAAAQFGGSHPNNGGIAMDHDYGQTPGSQMQNSKAGGLGMSPSTSAFSSNFLDGAENGSSSEKEALNLIYYDGQTRKYVVSDEAREFLRGIKDKVGVIAVAGKYRTGKSFLLNRVILNKKASGFGVGPTINPCTKGLWVWSETIESEFNGEKVRLLVIDSEGIGAFDEDVNHDTKIFLLALLLCSSFIFNSMNTIDENAINSLSLIVNLSQELQIKSEVLGECDPDEIRKYFPSFLWVVRDFSLRLIDLYGNSISQKEYLESALQPQKGNSDAVEQKNRIRRMIKQFFKDRDCFTMVRPVENERDLQNLQQMQDSQFRPEFKRQIDTLRGRIYKKTRPKMVNGRTLNGEMLLELCLAYTEAINTGSVPNIQNAWSYVCQNECQRTISTCIKSYEQQIQSSLETAKQELNIRILKEANKGIRETCVVQFRREAMGGSDGQHGQNMIQELEIKLRNQLGDKYQVIKQDFVRFCGIKAKAYLDDRTQMIRRSIQQAQYESLDQVQDDLAQIKNEYAGPKYPGHEILVAETTCQLLAKASDYLSISQNQNSQISMRRLNERVKELEAEVKDLRIEHQGEISEMQRKVADLQAEKTHCIKNEKLLEERLKRAREENERQLQQKEIQYKASLDHQSLSVQTLQQKLDLAEQHNRQTDSSLQKKLSEFEKLNALIEQKLQLTQQDLTEHKNKLAEKDKDYKEVQREHYQARVEAQQLKQQISRMESEHEDEVERLTSKHRKEIEKLQEEFASSAPAGDAQIEEKKWLKEREQMTRQMSLLTSHLDSSKKMQESLLQALTRQQEQAQTKKDHKLASVDGETDSQTFSESQETNEKLTQKNQELLSMNNNLSQQIVQMQNKQQQLEDDIKTLKKYKKLVNNSMALQCKHCANTLPKEQFQDHMKTCMEESDRNRASVLLPVAGPLPPPGGHVPGAQGGAHLGAPSPLLPPPAQRLRTSHIGHIGGAGSFYGGGHYQQSASILSGVRQYEIVVQECFTNQENETNSEALKDLTKIQYEMLIQANDLQDLNWVILKNLKEISEFQQQLQKQYQSFDFQGNNIALTINPPFDQKSNAETETSQLQSTSYDNDKVQFYFGNILKYEIQMFMEKVQKIPFIRDGNIFREFFEIQRHQHEISERDIDSINDSALVHAINLAAVGQSFGVNQHSLSRRGPGRNYPSQSFAAIAGGAGGLSRYGQTGNSLHCEDQDLNDEQHHGHHAQSQAQYGHGVGAPTGMPPLAGGGAASQRYAAGHGLGRQGGDNKITNQSPQPFERCTQKSRLDDSSTKPQIHYKQSSKPFAPSGEAPPKVPQLNLSQYRQDHESHVRMASPPQQPIDMALASPEAANDAKPKKYENNEQVAHKISVGGDLIDRIPENSYISLQRHQQEDQNGLDDRLRIQVDQNLRKMSAFQKIKDSSEILNSEKDFRESRPDEEVPQANVTNPAQNAQQNSIHLGQKSIQQDREDADHEKLVAASDRYTLQYNNRYIGLLDSHQDDEVSRRQPAGADFARNLADVSYKPQTAQSARQYFQDHRDLQTRGPIGDPARDSPNRNPVADTLLPPQAANLSNSRNLRNLHEPHHQTTDSWNQYAMKNSLTRDFSQPVYGRDETLPEGGRNSMDEEENVSSSQDPTEDLRQYRQFMNDLHTYNHSSQNPQALTERSQTQCPPPLPDQLPTDIDNDAPASQEGTSGHKSLSNLHSHSSQGHHLQKGQTTKLIKQKQPLFGGMKQMQTQAEVSIEYPLADSAYPRHPSSSSGSATYSRSNQKSASGSKKVQSIGTAAGTRAAGSSGSAGAKAMRQKSSRIGGPTSAKYEPILSGGGGPALAKHSGQSSSFAPSLQQALPDRYGSGGSASQYHQSSSFTQSSKYAHNPMAQPSHTRLKTYHSPNSSQKQGPSGGQSSSATSTGYQPLSNQKPTTSQISQHRGSTKGGKQAMSGNMRGGPSKRYE